MSDVVKVKVVVYEDDVEKRTLTVGYFHGQPYVVKIDTPDGVDRQYEGHIDAPADLGRSLPESANQTGGRRG